MMACCTKSHANEPFNNNEQRQPYKLQRNKVIHSGDFFYFYDYLTYSLLFFRKNIYLFICR